MGWAPFTSASMPVSSAGVASMRSVTSTTGPKYKASSLRQERRAARQALCAVASEVESTSGCMVVSAADSASAEVAKALVAGSAVFSVSAFKSGV
jgi:hypothetical protein